MREDRAKEILAALSPEALAERQRIVDAAVREARDSSYCDTFNTIIRRLMPEMMVTIDGSHYAIDSDGRACAQPNSDTRNVWDWYNGVYDAESQDQFNEDGYSPNGYDRDGFDRHGYDVEGFDANDHGRAYARAQRRTRWIDDNGQQQTRAEQVYVTGYGRSTGRDAQGNLRVGRAATEEELAAAAVQAAEHAAKMAGRFNPTTWKPEPATAPVTEPAMVDASK